MTRPPALLFGIPIADVTMDETVDLIGDWIADGRSQGRSRQIATVNVDFVVNAHDDPSLAEILRRADLCLADGMPLVWAARTVGTPIVERVAGSDLVPRLFARSASDGSRIHVLGSSPEVARRAEELVGERYPGADVTFDPGPRIDDPTAPPEGVLDSIVARDPDVLCVALGNPKQERFIAAHRDALGVPVSIGIGGSIDMLVGERKRAPTWAQRTGLEWVARALQEPGRLGRRYAHDLRVIVPMAAAEIWRARRQPDRPPRWSIDQDELKIVVGAADVDGGDWAGAVAALDDVARVTVSVAGPVGNVGAAWVVGLVEQARRHGSEVAWDANVPEVLRRFAELGVDAHQLDL